MYVVLVGLPIALKRGASVTHGGLRRGAGGDAAQQELLESRQRTALERGGEDGAAGVGDLGAREVEQLELLQPRSRRRWRARPRRRRHEGGEALVAEQVAREVETSQSRPPPQGWREGHQPRVADGGRRSVKGVLRAQCSTFTGMIPVYEDY